MLAFRKAAFLLALAPLLLSVLLSHQTSIIVDLQNAWKLQRVQRVTLGARRAALYWAAGWESSKCLEMQLIDVKCSGLHFGVAAGEGCLRGLFTVFPKLLI